VHWAADPSFSFLLVPNETRALIASAGFRQTTWLTGADLEAELDRSDEADPGEHEPLLDSGLLDGPDSAAMGENVAPNLKEGPIVPAIGVFERV